MAPAALRKGGGDHLPLGAEASKQCKAARATGGGARLTATSRSYLSNNRSACPRAGTTVAATVRPNPVDPLHGHHSRDVQPGFERKHRYITDGFRHCRKRPLWLHGWQGEAQSSQRNAGCRLASRFTSSRWPVSFPAVSVPEVPEADKARGANPRIAIARHKTVRRPLGKQRRLPLPRDSYKPRSNGGKNALAAGESCEPDPPATAPLRTPRQRVD